MNREIRLRERAESSCRVLARLIKKEKQIKRRELMRKDFTSKIVGVEPQLACKLVSEVSPPEGLPAEYQALLKTFQKGLTVRTTRAKPETIESSRRKLFDLAIVTILKDEFDSVKIAFGIGPDEGETIRSRGYRFWEETVRSKVLGDLKVVIMMVGEARDTPCAIACDELFRLYSTKSCLLVGTAAGLEEKVKKGDVVAASAVLDYDSERRESGVTRYRPEQQPLQSLIKRDLSFFIPRMEWQNELRAGLQQLSKMERLPEDAVPGWESEYHDGVILSGDNLLADGSLSDLRDKFHERARAADQESNGFARVCHDHSVPWLVFRGISDYGIPQKPDTWRRTATLAAATAALDFIRREYRGFDDKTF